MRYYSTTAGEMVLQAGISDVATAITLDTVAGLPASYPYTLVIDPGAATEEAVEVTAGAGTNLTVTRGFDNTLAIAHGASAKVRHMVTALDIRLSRQHEAALSGVHGVAGSVVGTTDAQALTNKDLTAGNTFPASLATDAEVSGAVTTHAGAADPHGDRAFATGAVATHTGAADPHGDRAYAATQDAAHVAAGDPHTQYAKKAGDTFTGVVTLDAAPDISAANTGGGLVVQNGTSRLRIDPDEMQASSAGAASTLTLNPFGGNVSIGGNLLAPANMDWGVVTLTRSGSSFAQTTVPFGKTFASPPRILLTINSGIGSTTGSIVRATGITTTQFDAIINDVNGSVQTDAVAVAWWAFIP